MMNKTTYFKFPLVLIIVMMGLGAVGNKVAYAANNLSAKEARSIAAEAYVYGFPMVIGYKTMQAYSLDDQSPDYKGPFNKLICEARVYTPDDKVVVTPNSDTPYCFVWADLRREPLALSVPGIEDGRYYSWQLIDLYTHNFAYVGTLSTGNEANTFLITGPNWNGAKPVGVSEVFTSETDYILAIVRTQLNGNDDLPQVKKIQTAYKIEPLSAFLGEKVTQMSNLPTFPKWVEGAQFDERLFVYLDFMLSLIEPVEDEIPLIARFANIGLGTGEPFNMSELPKEIQEALKLGAKSGFDQITSFLKEHGSDPLVSAKIFGTRTFLSNSAIINYDLENHYLIRAAAAHAGIYGNTAAEATYPTYFTDSQGNPLDAAMHDYTLTFNKGQFPPVRAFWSLTIYDGKTQLLVDNPLNRYLLNSAMIDKFKKEADGSIVFHLQKKSPGKALEANWLPAPDGPFYAALRLYGPKPDALEGKWNPPALERSN